MTCDAVDDGDVGEVIVLMLCQHGVYGKWYAENACAASSSSVRMTELASNGSRSGAMSQMWAKRTMELASQQWLVRSLLLLLFSFPFIVCDSLTDNITLRGTWPPLQSRSTQQQ